MTLNTQPTCSEFKKLGDLKSNCLVYLKTLLEHEKKKKRKLTFKKVNLTNQGEVDIYPRDDKEDKEEAHLCLIAFDDEIDEVYNSNLSYFSYNDKIDNLYNELYDSLVKAKKDFKNKLVENALLHENVKQLEKKKIMT